jgi:hypothetical protein
MSRKKALITAAVLATLTGIYALVGFYWIPRFASSQVSQFFDRQYDRQVSLGSVHFNPFTFEFEARDFSLPDADGQRMLGFGRFYVDFELSSLWHRAWTFSEIAVERPYARIVQRADGRLNWLDLVPQDDTQPPTDAESPGVPAVRIGELSVADGEVDIEDRSRPQPFATGLEPVTFNLMDFRTAGGGNAFAFTAGSDAAGTLHIEGSLGVEPFSSTGSFQLGGLEAATVSEYLGDLLPVTLLSGVIDLAFTYDFSLAGEPFTFILDMPSLAIRDLATVARGHEVPWQVPLVDVRDTHVDLAARSVTIASVEVKDVMAPAWIDETGFNAPGVLQRSESTASSAPAQSEPGDDTPGWSVSIPNIVLRDTRLPFEDRTLAQPASLEIVADSLRVSGFALPAREPLHVDVEVTSSAGGQIAASGSVQLEPLQAGMDVKVDGLSLLPVQPYLDGQTDLLLESGTLTSSGRVELSAIDPLAMTYAGDVGIKNLHTRDRPLKEDFVNWKSLELSGIRYSSAPARLDIREITAREPYLRLVLATNGVSNIESVLDPEGAAEKAAAIAAENAAAKGKKAGKAGRAEAAPAAPAGKATPAAPAMPIKIDNTRIVDGNVNFADYTIEPNFRIAMEQLNGTIEGSSSEPGSRSELKLDGEVDRYAPVHIAGQLNLLAPATFIDISGSFSNIDLTSFNPYSTKFIGYQIAKGKLSIDTQYKVEDRRLEALHMVRLDQLEFGERIDSPDAIGLPIKLAVALLKDSAGVIDLELPIGGSIDDPRFKVGPVIWKAFVGLLTKIVTAPFALLGNLFGGGADLSFIDFGAGSTNVDAAAMEKIAALKKALIERPSLKLEIPWTVAPAIDGPALEQARWEAMVSGAISEPSAGSWKTDRQDYLRRLKVLYEQTAGKKPDLPKPPKPAEGEPKPDPVEFAIGQLEPGLRAGVVVGADEVDALAKARAQAVRDALLGEEGLAAERVFVTRGEESEAIDGAVRMTLSLQ